MKQNNENENVHREISEGDGNMLGTLKQAKSWGSYRTGDMMGVVMCSHQFIGFHGMSPCIYFSPITIKYTKILTKI